MYVIMHMYSPDLNPIEKFWSWLGKELRRRDLKDLREGRPVLGKIAYRLRVKAVLRSPKSQQVASRCAGALKKCARPSSPRRVPTLASNDLTDDLVARLRRRD